MAKIQLICPNCGSEEYSIQNAGGSTTTFLMCSKCGRKGTAEGWKKQQDQGDDFNKIDLRAFNLSEFEKAARSVGDSDMGSNKPSADNDPTIIPRDNLQKNRKRPERRLQHSDPEDVSPQTSGSRATEAEKMTFNLQKFMESKPAAFNLSKFAREWQWTEEQKERKDLGKNMVFPEGDQSDKDGKKSKGTDKIDDEARRFDPIDRKDMHSSPDPKTFIPGYEEWYNREVDKFYDGWVEDHVVNSGGSVPGSNTEKKMNLNKDERYHAPEFPTEAPTERLLETRHHFDDDYQRFVADSHGNMYTTGALEAIKSAKAESGKCPKCARYGEGITCAACANDKIRDSKELPVSKQKLAEKRCPDCEQFGATCPTCANKRTEDEKKNSKKHKIASAYPIALIKNTRVRNSS